MFVLVNNYKYLIAAIVTCAIFTVFGAAGFQQEHTDYISILEMLLDSGCAGDSFFALPVVFFSFFEGFGISATVVAVTWGLVLTGYLFYNISNYKDYLVMMFFYLPAPMLYYFLPSKELFFISFLFLFFSFYEKKWKGRSVLLLMVYSLLFRFYVAVFALSLWASKNKLRMLLPFVMLLPALLLYYEDELLGVLWRYMSRRDISYDLHFLDVRSGWCNPVSEYGWYGFFYNYSYAFMKLTFPVFFEFTYKELYLQVYVTAVYLLLFISVKKNKSMVVSFLMMCLLYPLFEPDLGSYLRHLSSWHPLFIWLYLSNDYKTIRLN